MLHVRPAHYMVLRDNQNETVCLCVCVCVCVFKIKEKTSIPSLTNLFYHKTFTYVTYQPLYITSRHYFKMICKK